MFYYQDALFSQIQKTLSDCTVPTQLLSPDRLPGARAQEGFCSLKHCLRPEAAIAAAAAEAERILVSFIISAHAREERREEEGEGGSSKGGMSVSHSQSLHSPV